MIKSKRRLLLVVLFIVIISILTLFFYQKSKDELNSPISSNGFFLGTIINIKIYEDVDEEIFTDIFTLLESIENKMSINLEDSEVIKINNDAGKSAVQVSEDTFYVIEKGLYYSQLSEGNFDISIGPLVKLWGIGSEDAKVPTEEELNLALDKIDYNDVTINSEESSVKLEKEYMVIDLGGIAKGYAADKVAEYLREKGINSATINLGGNIYALGSKDGEPWTLGVQDPFDSRGAYFAVIEVEDKTVVTSGIYERFFEENGVRYHHILSPYTGYPIENSLASVSIITDNSIDADALSTTVFSLGLEKGMELIETLKDTEAVFVDEKYNVYITSGLKGNFTITNPAFKLAN